jgi:hypothetical protein
MHRIEQRLRRLERRRALAACDPRAANRIAVECYDRGERLPDTLSPEERKIAEAIYAVLHFYDNQWDYDAKLPLEAHGHATKS